MREAANLLTNEFKSEHPDTQWQLITGMRNYIVHEYFHEKPEFVAAWRNYGKNVIVTMPAIWEMSSDASNAKITSTSSRA